MQTLAKPTTAQQLIPLIQRLAMAFGRTATQQDVITTWLPLLEGIPWPCIERAANDLMKTPNIYFVPQALVSRASEYWSNSILIAGTVPPAPLGVTDAEWASAWREVAAYGHWADVMQEPAQRAVRMKRQVASRRPSANLFD